MLPTPVIRLLCMRQRILCVGTDTGLLKGRQMLLEFRRYDASTATPFDVDKKLAAGTFDLVILSVTLGELEKQRIERALPPETKVLSLTYLVQPDELLEMVTRAIGFRK
jgi:DNA-binding response OmpR family regulator